MIAMAKKKKPVLYLEVNEVFKARLRRIAQYHNRTATGEAIHALEHYVRAQEKKLGDRLPPLEESE